MKDFLEKLEIGEDKIKLSKEEIKEILAKHGEYVNLEKDKVDDKYKQQLDDNKATIDELKAQLDEAPKTDDLENLKQTIADYEQKEKDREAKLKQEEEERVLDESINSLFEGKTFTSNYAKQGLLNDIKNGYRNPDNKGKGIKEIFEELTKDTTDIFTSPNEIKDMEGMGDSEETNNIKEMPIIW